MHQPQPHQPGSRWREDGSVAFNRVFHHFYAPLVFFARKYVPDVLAAEDIVTDIFLKFWQKQHNFNEAQSVKAFLYISTRNACINHCEYERSKARAHAIWKYLSTDYEECILPTIIHNEMRREVYQLVESLPLQCRKIVIMSYLAGLSNQQIANRLQISVHTVRNQKLRGIRLMQMKVQGAVLSGVEGRSGLSCG